MNLFPLIALLIPVGISAIVGYNGLLSLLPIISFIMYTVSLWKGNLKVFRIMCIITSIMWLIYNSIIFAFAGVISNIIELIGGFKAILKYRKKTTK